MDCATEQDFLSGIEPLSNSDMSTPHRSQLEDVSMNQEMSHRLAHSDDSDYGLLRQTSCTSTSPTKLTSDSISHMISCNEFSNAAEEITKKIQDSLTSSLKLEKEAEAYLSENKRLSSSSFGRHSAGNTPLSLSPSKMSSPSKLKVRFEDDLLKTKDLQENDFAQVNSSILSTPTKTSREDYIVISPSKKYLDAKVKTPMKCSIEASLFSSLKLPQNDKEREKISEFLRNMETSGAGDPLASLFDLEYDLKLSDLNSKPDSSTNIKSHGGAIQSVPKIQEKDGDFKIKRRKGDAKRNLEKNFNKKTSKLRNESSARNPLPKKSSAHVKKNSNDVKAVKSSSKGVASKSETKTIQFTAEGKKTIGNMETIRNHLHGMLKMDGSHANTQEVSQDFKLCFDEGDARCANPNGDPLNSSHSSDTATLLSANPADFLPSGASSESGKDNVDALIDSATSSIFSLLKGNNMQQLAALNKRPTDATVNTEITILRDSLEKERYRRNHCEKQIQCLQNRILEIQQELAVGQSVTRKKDMMIEQLDKTLAKVVSGWKGHEQTLVNSVQALTGEKTKLMAELKKKNEVTTDLKSKLTKVLEEYSAMRERLLLKEEEQTLLQQSFQLKTHEISRVLDQKHASIEKLLNDKQSMVADINKLTRKIEEMQCAVEEEKEKISQELLKEKKALQEDIRKEKLKSAQSRSRNADLQKMLSSTQDEVTRLEELMGSLRQTIENLQLQSSVEEAKYAASTRKMAAEHQIEMEKKVTEKLAKYHEDAEQKERELRDSHHKQVMEITRSHESELANQCKLYEERIDQLERRSREDMEMKDRKLKEKTEGMRQQMMSKMQNLLQAHYNETLEVVGNTSGNTPVRTQGSRYLHHLHSSDLFSGNTLQDISNLNVSTATLGDTFRQSGKKAHPENSLASADHTKMSRVSELPTFTTENASNPPFVTTQLTSSAFSFLNASAAPNYLSGMNQGMHGFQQRCYEAEINIPMSTMVTPSREPDEMTTNAHDRKQCLQHYIKTLLDRSPGEPLEIPQPSTAPIHPIPPPSLSDNSPHFQSSQMDASANKENDTADPSLPKHATSEVALGVISFLNQQLQSQPSPDFIPVEKSLTITPPLSQSNVPNSKQTSRTSAFSHVKITHQPQAKTGTHGQLPTKRSPRKQDVQLSVKDLERIQTPHTEQQVGDVSRMLSAYMSGDTQEAAEKLISYLTDSQRKVMQEGSFRVGQMGKSTGKTKTPSKNSLPAWR